MDDNHRRPHCTFSFCPPVPEVSPAFGPDPANALAAQRAEVHQTRNETLSVPGVRSESWSEKPNRPKSVEGLRDGELTSGYGRTLTGHQALLQYLLQSRTFVLRLEIRAPTGSLPRSTATNSSRPTTQTIANATQTQTDQSRDSTTTIRIISSTRSTFSR